MIDRERQTCVAELQDLRRQLRAMESAANWQAHNDALEQDRKWLFFVRSMRVRVACSSGEVISVLVPDSQCLPALCRSTVRDGLCENMSFRSTKVCTLIGL